MESWRNHLTCQRLLLLWPRILKAHVRAFNNLINFKGSVHILEKRHLVVLNTQIVSFLHEL